MYITDIKVNNGRKSASFLFVLAGLAGHFTFDRVDICHDISLPKTAHFCILFYGTQ